MPTFRSRSTTREQSVARILDATLEVISRRGLEKLSLTDVCHQAGVSRTTLYRHFPTKELLLEAYVAREASRLERSMLETMEATPDVRQRLQAMAALWPSEGVMDGRRLLEVEPGFVLQFFERLQPHQKVIHQQALAPVFDEAERSGLKLDREMVAELVLRIRESVYLVPPSEPGKNPIKALVDLLEMLPGWPKPPAGTSGR